MFDDMNKTIREGQSRWKEIEECCEDVKDISQGEDECQNINEINIGKLSKLLLLIVDHLRPMNPTQGQLDDVTKGLTDLLGSLTGKADE